MLAQGRRRFVLARYGIADWRVDLAGEISDIRRKHGTTTVSLKEDRGERTSERHS